jgi:halogenation protein CepH
VVREERFDVVVVGGGPGGSTASTLLSKAGLSVVQLEREHHPRHQIGESLLPATIHGICRQLGVWQEVHDAGFVRKRGGTFRWGRRRDPWTFAFATTTGQASGYAFQVERSRFDKILFDNATRSGVDTREGVEVKGLIIGDDGRAAGVVAEEQGGQQVSISAKYVVDASGHGSRLARFVGERVHSDFFQNVAVYGYFDGAARMPAPNAGNITTAAFENGWCWFIPLSDTLTSVGAVVDRRHASAIGQDREAALMGFVEQCPMLDELLAPAERVTDGMYGAVRVRKDWSYTTDRLERAGVLLIGDAGCFVDPVFSSGVHLSTYGGLLAARTIATVLAGELTEAEVLEEFERRYRREFRVWYDFLLAFFDLGQDWDNYFWSARTVLGSDEQANDAFIRLVAGGGSAPGDFFAHREGIGERFGQLIDVLAEENQHAGGAEGSDASATTELMDERTRESRYLVQGGRQAPLFEGGLVPSADGLRWDRSGVLERVG